MRALLVPFLAVGVAVSGCATKKYVSREVGEVNQKVDTLATEVEKTQERTRRNEAGARPPTNKARRTFRHLTLT